MCACLTREVLVKYPRGEGEEEEEERIEFSQQTNSFCVTPSNASEHTRESGEEEGEEDDAEEEEEEVVEKTKNIDASGIEKEFSSERKMSGYAQYAELQVLTSTWQ